jgi:hypothetical protein
VGKKSMEVGAEIASFVAGMGVLGFPWRARLL